MRTCTRSTYLSVYLVGIPLSSLLFCHITILSYSLNTNVFLSFLWCEFIMWLWQLLWWRRLRFESFAKFHSASSQCIKQAANGAHERRRRWRNRPRCVFTTLHRVVQCIALCIVNVLCWKSGKYRSECLLELYSYILDLFIMCDGQIEINIGTYIMCGYSDYYKKLLCQFFYLLENRFFFLVNWYSFSIFVRDFQISTYKK